MTLSGIVFFGLRTLLSYIKFKCKIKNEPFVVSKDIIEILEGVRCPQKKISDFKIIKTNLVSVPLLIGFNMPIIILPEIVLSKEELYYILRHEATHYYNHDIWIKMFIELICILYWWNPLIYILKREIDKLIEIRVDIAVTQTFNELERINYLDCLLKIAKGKAPSHSNSFALAFDCRTASVLSQRFHIVLAHNDGHSFNLRRYIFFVTFVIAVMLASLIVIEPYSVDSDTQQNTVVLEDDNSYLIENTGGGFNLYYNNEYFGTVTEIKESYSDLPVYKNYEEVQKYENKK